VAESKGVQSDLIPRIATGFCGGISRTSGICGAVSGAILALNIFYGRMDAGTSTDASYAKVQAMVSLFERQFGTTNCTALTGCNLATAEGQRIFKANNTIERCKHFSQEAVKMVLTLI
jgi:C_GCAxxG_C_C family probable redox protein